MTTLRAFVLIFVFVLSNLVAMHGVASPFYSKQFNGESTGMIRALHVQNDQIWLAAENGLFGLLGSNVVKFDMTNSLLASNYIVDIESFGEDSFIIGAFGDGLYHYNNNTRKLSRFSVPLTSIQSVWSLASNESYLIINTISDVHVLDKRTLQRVFSLSEIISQKYRAIRHIGADKEALWWIDAESVVNKVNFADKTFSFYSEENNFPKDTQLTALLVDKGEVFVGTNQGIFKLDDDKESFYSLMKDGPKVGGSVYKIKKGTNEDLLFSAGQLYKIDGASNNLLTDYQIFPSLPKEKFNTILDFYFDESGNFYGVDAQKGFFYIPYKAGGIKIFHDLNIDSASLVIDKRIENSKVFLLTGDSLVRYDTNNESSKSVPLVSNEADKIAFVKGERVWLVNHDSELIKVDFDTLEKNTFGKILSPFKKGMKIKQVVESDSGKLYLLVTENYRNMVLEWDGNGVRNVFEGRVSKIAVSADNQLYLAEVYRGIYRIDLSASTLQVTKDTSLSLAEFACLTPDQKGRLWVCGDGEGLYLKNGRSTKQLPAFANYYIRDVAQVSDDIFLVASNSGLFAYDETGNKVIPIGKEFGITDVDFEYDGFANGLEHTLVAGDEYIYLIDNERFIAALNSYTMESHTVAISPDSILTSSGTKILSNYPISHDDSLHSINLPYNFSTLNLFAASDNFINHEHQKLEYSIDGVTNKWLVEKSNPARLTISGLDSGTYLLKVRVFDESREHPATRLQIVVATPPWLSKNAFYSYIFLVVLLIAAITYRFHLLQKRRTQAAAQQAKEQQALKEANEAYVKAKVGRKQRLFLRISHELQTPLSLILGPLQQVRQAPDDERNPHRLEVINRNARRMHLLINQLLEVERFESGNSAPAQSYALDQQLPLMLANLEAVLQPRQQVLVSKLKVNGHIRLTQGAMESILLGLLSFAAGRTPDKGTIEVRAKSEGLQLHIQVLDAGDELNEQECDQLFKQFTATEDHTSQPNWKKGLALVKELVLANDGWIGIDNSAAGGACLSVHLPLVPLAAPSTTAQVLVKEEVRPAPVADTSRPIILLADNNADMRRYLLEALKDSYTCLEACDGKQVIQIMQSITPQLIVCQAQLAHRNGLELAATVNTTPGQPYIPFVLTCHTQDDSFRHQCSKASIDAVLSQPIEISELQDTVTRLLTLQERYLSQTSVPAAAKTPFAVPRFASVRDQAFYTRFLAVLHERYQEEGFGRAEAAKAVAISERQMARKLNTLFEQPFNELLKRYRLHQARGLLEKGMQITQVAFAVGFTTSSYFSSSFKAVYAQTPSQYQEQATHQAAS